MRFGAFYCRRFKVRRSRRFRLRAFCAEKSELFMNLPVTSIDWVAGSGMFLNVAATLPFTSPCTAVR